MKRLKDITKEQAIEIAKLIYPFSDGVKGEYDFTYQPYDPTWYEDAREFVRLKFRGVTFGDTVDNIILDIEKNFDCWLNYSRPDGLHILPTRNQYAIHKQFIDWGFEPDYSEDK